MKYKYKVNGLDCANCTQKLEDALNKKEEINDCNFFCNRYDDF